jgi:prepilin-type N-terminal cleavage/methylation domain-containing protein/prepilin-type processing-associated H-X9-DG protein
MSRKNPSSASAFTLIEVLVVVAIIALLISILLPSLSAAREQARNAKCLANMRDMATGVMTFSLARKNRFQLVTGGDALPSQNAYALSGPRADPERSTYVYESGPLPPGKQGPALLAWPVVLLREAGNRSLRRNSDWGIAAANRHEARGQVREHEQMLCPADTFKVGSPWYPYRPDDGRWFGALSYTINEDIAGDDRETGYGTYCFANGNPNGGARLKGHLDKIVRPGEVLLVIDGGTDSITGEDRPNLLLSKDAPSPYLEFCTKKWDGRVPENRHMGGGLNIAFADGHGGSVKKARGKYPRNMPEVNDYAYLPRVRVSPYNVGSLPDSLQPR